MIEDTWYKGNNNEYFNGSLPTNQNTIILKLIWISNISNNT